MTGPEMSQEATRKHGVIMKKTIFVKDIKPGDRINEFFLVAEKNSAFSQKGALYLNMKLKDKTGEIEAKVWDNVEELNRLCKKGDFVYVRSRAVSYRNMTQLTLLDLRPALPDEVGPYDFFPDD